MGCPHTGYRKGMKIIVMMKSGKSFVDKYIGAKSGVIITEDKGRTKVKDIRNTSIFRQQMIDERE